MIALNDEFVTWAYRVLLGREPESQAIVAKMVSSNLSPKEFVDEFMKGAELHQRYPDRIRSSNAWVWAEFDDYLLRVNLQDDFISWPAIENRFEKAETAFLKSSLRPGSIAVDIGANLGYYTMLMASVVGKGGRVYSFEPVPALFESMMISIKKNGFDDRVVAFKAAVSDRAGTVPMFFASRTRNWGGAAFWTGRNLPPGHEVVNVPADRLSAFFNLDRLDFIKVDAEGAEPLVIRGGSDILSKCKPIVLSEIHTKQLQSVSGCSSKDYLDLMSKIGYEGRLLTREGEIGDVVDPGSKEHVINVVFVPRELRHKVLVLARDDQGRALRLPFTVEADQMRVHDAYEFNGENRLRAARAIAFDANRHSDVAEPCLFFGPHLSLQPGDYVFRLRGALDGQLKLRLTQRFASEALFETVIESFDRPIRLRLDAMVEKFEIIGEKTKRTRAMTLRSIEVTWEEPNGETPDPTPGSGIGEEPSGLGPDDRAGLPTPPDKDD